MRFEIMFFNDFKKQQGADEKGFVLILTMVMLAVLSILGIMVLNSSDTELSITTNYRMNTDAFIAAELATQYAQQKVINDHSEDIDDAEYSLIDDDSDISSLLPQGIELYASGINEIFHYTGQAPKNMFGRTSTDAYQKNIYRTSDSTSSQQEGDAAFYRVSVETRKNNRSSARIESLFVNRGGQVF
ncbi:pilus assembly PilX family protein [Vibrio sp.]|uniref:pilus assembly PilX family protein n=1 Tax=Vibrio sp. TaxID=678 RepID=UPI003D0DBFCA